MKPQFECKSYGNVEKNKQKGLLNSSALEMKTETLFLLSVSILHIYTAKGLREYAFAAAEKLRELGKLDSKEHKGKVNITTI